MQFEKLIGEAWPREEELDGKPSMGSAVAAALPLALVKELEPPWRRPVGRRHGLSYSGGRRVCPQLDIRKALYAYENWRREAAA